MLLESRHKWNRFVEIGGLAVVLALIYVSRIAKFAEPDFFMHLRVGQWILENRTIPRQDVFSHVAMGKPWTDHEWLFQVCLYLLYRVGGWSLLSHVRCFLLSLSYYFTYRTCRLLKLSESLSLSLTLVAASMAMGSVEFRPQVVTYLLFPLYFYIMLRYLLGYQARLWLLPLLMVPWANMHGAFVAVFVLGALLLGAEFIKHVAAKFVRPLPGTLVPIERLAKLTAVLGLTFLTTVINPYGAEMLLFPFKVIQHPIFFQMIFEWMPPEFPFFTPFWTVIAVLVVVIIPAWRQIDFRNTLLILAWTYLSLSARRNIVLFGYVAVPLFGQIVAGVESLIQEKGVPWLRRLHWLPRALVHAYAVFLVYAVGETLVKNAVHEFGIGINSTVPTATGDFILEHRPVGNMYNEYNVGGYLIYRLYPHYLVYQDGRVDVYGPKLFYDYKVIESGNPRWRKAVKERDLNIFVLTYGGTSYPGNLASQLDDDPEWDLVHFDDTCLVYVRNSGPNRELAKKYAYHYLKPGHSPDSYLTTADIQTSAIAELDRALAKVPNSKQALGLKLLCLGALGRYDEAEAVAQKILEIAENKSRAWEALGQVAMNQHKYEEALQRFKKAVEYNARNARAWRFLGDVFEAQGKNEEALEAYVRAADLSTVTDMSVFPAVARVASRLGKDSLALRYWERYLEWRPGDIVALNDAGTLCLRAKNYTRAIALFKRAAETAPENPAPYYNLACAYTAVGNAERGLFYLRGALERGGQTIAEIAEQDADLEALRSLPQFRELLTQIKTTTSTATEMTTATLVRTIKND
jgi:tetratricopeptide (TPR) repeat protein